MINKTLIYNKLLIRINHLQKIKNNLIHLIQILKDLLSINKNNHEILGKIKMHFNISKKLIKIFKERRKFYKSHYPYSKKKE